MYQVNYCAPMVGHQIIIIRELPSLTDILKIKYHHNESEQHQYK
jgi:hypothetical protein